MLNRCTVIVEAKQPFLDWLKSLPDPPEVSLDQVNSDQTAYLLPEYAFDNEQGSLLKQFYDLIFEEELLAWWNDEKDWPETRDLATFKKWFDVEFHSMILDLVEHPLLDKDVR